MNQPEPTPEELLAAVRLAVQEAADHLNQPIGPGNEALLEALETVVALRWLSRHEAYIDYHQEDVTIVLAHGNDPPDAWTGDTLLEVYREIRARYDPETP